jgi:hypothetical protein
MSGVWLLVLVLAVWRATHLLHAEDGPWDVVARLRRLAARAGLARVFECFYCLSLWVALLPAIAHAGGWIDGAAVWFALSGGAILLHRATESKGPPPPTWTESVDSSEAPRAGREERP